MYCQMPSKKTIKNTHTHNRVLNIQTTPILKQPSIWLPRKYMKAQICHFLLFTSQEIEKLNFTQQNIHQY